MSDTGREDDRQLIFDELKTEHVGAHAELDTAELIEKARYYQDLHGHEPDIAFLLEFYEATGTLNANNRDKLVDYCARENTNEEW